MGPPEPEQGTIVVKQETATPHKDKCEEGTPNKDGARGSPQAPRIRMKVSPKAVAKAKAKAKARAKANAQSQPAEGHYEAPDREAWKDVRYQLQKLENAGKGSGRMSKGKVKWQKESGTMKSLCLILKSAKRLATRQVCKRKARQPQFP